MIGLGRIGANMVRRLMRAGHQCPVYDQTAPAVEALAKEGAAGADSLDDLVARLRKARAVGLMVPAAAVDSSVDELAPRLDPGDVIIDGGNSYYVDDIRRAAALHARGVWYVDVGTSGGVWGLERGYCLMIGGPAEAVRHLDPIFPPTSAPRSTSASPPVAKTTSPPRCSPRCGTSSGTTSSAAGRLIRPRAPTAWPAARRPGLAPERRLASHPGGPRPARGR